MLAMLEQLQTQGDRAKLVQFALVVRLGILGRPMTDVEGFRELFELLQV